MGLQTMDFKPITLGILDPELRPTPEKRLLVAVLCRALGDIGVADGHVDKPDRRSARQWLDSDCYRPMSFVWLCEHLDLDPEHVRSSIVKFQKQLLN